VIRAAIPLVPLQASSRPGTAPPLGLRAGVVAPLVMQTANAKETLMGFGNKRFDTRRGPEALEDRAVPASLSLSDVRARSPMARVNGGGKSRSHPKSVFSV
jgi:hypothetical protein